MKFLMRDENLQDRGILPVLSGTAVFRNNDLSTWNLVVNGNNSLSARFKPGWGIQAFDDYGNQMLSGPALSIEEDVSADSKTRTLNIAGVSDEIFLADSLVIPNPPEGAEANSDLWKASGPVETVMMKLIQEQIGPDAPDDYRIDRLRTATDRGRGETVSLSERFSNILEVLQEQATTPDLLFTVRQVKGELVFRVSEPRDLRRVVRLTRHNGGVGAYNASRSAPEATEAIVGGVGSGSTRKLWRVANDVGEWGRRVTTFVDRQSTSDENELQQAAEAELESKGESSSVTFDARNTPRKKFGRDFLLGDKITVDLDGSLIQDTLQTAELTWNETGQTMKFQVGPVADESRLNNATGMVLDLYKRVWSEVRRNQTR